MKPMVRCVKTWALGSFAALAFFSPQVQAREVQYLIPNVPELKTTDKSLEAQLRVGEIPPNPGEDVLSKWQKVVEATLASGFTEQKDNPSEIACLQDSNWRLLSPKAADPPCNQKGTTCYAIEGKLEEGVDVPGTIRLVERMSEEVARQYAAFQYLRRGHDLTKHDKRLASMAVLQGLSVLYRAERMLNLREGARKTGCSLKPLATHFEFAEQAVEDVRNAQLPAIFDTYPPKNRKWQRALYDAQKTIISGAHKLASESGWHGVCQQVSTSDGKLEGFDAYLAAWCGYAYYRTGEKKQSEQLFDRARQSTSNADMSSYASWAVRNLGRSGDTDR